MNDERPAAAERSVASVGTTKARLVRLQRRLALATVAMLGAVALVWYYIHLTSDTRAADTRARSAVRATASSEMKLPALAARPAPVSAAPAAETPAGAPELQPERANIGSPTVVGRPEAGPRESARAVESAAAPVLLRGSVASTSTAPPAAAEDDSHWQALRRLALGTEHGASAAAAATATTLGESLVPTTTPAVQAAVLPTRRWLLPKGSFLDCTLETAIDSTLPGLATCVLAVDAFGADGRVVLLERGTRLVGETRAEIRAGQARVSALWAEARTPTGVVVALASPGTDALGRAGVPGDVDNHFAARFGAAVLLSVIDGAISGFVAHEQGSAGVIYNPQTSRDVGTEALRGTIGIPPTVRVPAGSRVQVIVARDVDFRAVYGLAPRADN